MGLKVLVQTASGEFKGGGFYEPQRPITGTDADGNPIYDPAYSVVELPGEAMPDQRLERYDAPSPTKRRAATAAEISSFDDAQKTARAQSEGAQDIVRTTVAWVLKRALGRNPTAAEFTAGMNEWRAIYSFFAK